MSVRCHICCHLNDQGKDHCRSCGFPLSDGGSYLSEFTPDLVPDKVAQRVINFLNKASARQIVRKAPLFSSTAVGQQFLAEFAAAGERRALADIGQLASFSGMTPGAFSELVWELGVEKTEYVPELAEDRKQPAEPTFSASRTKLSFEYKILLPGPYQGKTGIISPFRCSSCSTFAPVFAKDLGEWEVNLDVTKVILSSEDDDFISSVSMDFSVGPYDYMRPINRKTNSFTFPAIMQLNNNMIIKILIKKIDKAFVFRSRGVVQQYGYTTIWPPYGTRLHINTPTVYYLEGDMSGEAALLVQNGTTFLEGPSAFLNHRADIISWSFAPDESIELTWNPSPSDSKYEREADFYYVYRSFSTSGAGTPFARVSPQIKKNTWRDFGVPPGTNSVTYRVVPVWVTHLGEEFEGFPGLQQRVEAMRSPFRTKLRSYQR